MITNYICTHSVKENSSVVAKEKDREVFAFTGPKEVKQFLKEHLLKFKDIHHIYGAFSKNVSYSYSEVMKAFKDKKSYNIIGVEKDGTTHYYRLEVQEIRGWKEKRPKREVGEKWIVKKGNAEIHFNWSSFTLCFVTIVLNSKDAMRSSSSKNSPAEALKWANKELKAQAPNSRSGKK